MRKQGSSFRLARQVGPDRCPVKTPQCILVKPVNLCSTEWGRVNGCAEHTEGAACPEDALDLMDLCAPKATLCG